MAKSGEMCTTRCMLFRNEMINKENALRVRWFVKNRQRLLDNLRDEKLASRVKEIKSNAEKETRQRNREDENSVCKIIIL